MTMIVACHFGDGAVVIADSRVTWGRAGNAHGDIAQKIFPVAPKTAIAIAGDVRLATRIGGKVQTEINKDKRSRIPSVIASHLPRVAKFCFKENARDVAFVLAGVGYDGKINLWLCQSPHFLLQAIGKNRPIVVGTGEVVRGYLEQKFKDLMVKNTTLKDKANELLIGLGGELGKHGVTSVGGLFQTILISKEGIAPLEYGYYDLSPEGGDSKEMIFEGGKWVQRDLTKGLDVSLVSPSKILRSRSIDKKFHDYDSPLGKKQEPRWHLSYFFTAIVAIKDVEKTEIEAPITEIGSYYYPRKMPLPVFIGLWGSNGDQKIEFYQNLGEENKLIHSSVIKMEFMPEQNEFDFVLMLNISQPGPVFLDCYVSGQFLGRRALYFGKVDKPVSEDKHELEKFKQTMDKELIDAHTVCSDPIFSKKSAILEYFILCEKVEISKSYYRFIREPKTIYFKKYPFIFRTIIGAGLRLPKGEHKITIGFVNVANRIKTEIGNVLVTPSSDCFLVPVEGDLVVNVPSKGLYFFNLYLNDELVGSSVLAFEDDDPKFSYNLYDDDIQRIKNGEYLALMKRSQQRKTL